MGVIGEKLGVYWGDIGIMGNKMELLSGKQGFALCKPHVRSCQNYNLFLGYPKH